MNAVLPVRPDEPNDAGNKNQLDTKVEAVKDGFEARIRLPFVAELHAYVSENVAPGPGADEGVEVEA